MKYIYFTYEFIFWIKLMIIVYLLDKSYSFIELLIFFF